jgi:predicted transcriptional regulator
MSLSGHAQVGSAEQTAETTQEPHPEEILSLLNAEYTESILESIHTEAKAARDIAEQCNASRPTVYRRLNGLQEAGLVETAMLYDVDGHHRTVFEATFEELSIDVTDEGLDVTITTNASTTVEPGLSQPLSGD